MTRNEWRRRLGRDSYGRAHPKALVRILVLYALDPEDARREAAADEALRHAAARLLDGGLGRRETWGEILRLSQAIWEVLGWTELEFDRTWTLMGRIDRRIHQTLGWLESPATRPSQRRSR